MILSLIWGVMIAAGLLSCLFVAARIWFHPHPTADEVLDFLVPIDLQKAEGLLDPGLECSLRVALSPSEFRNLQRKRIQLYLECLRRMAHNAAILVECANNEAARTDEQIAHLARALQQEAVIVRIHAVFTSVKLHFWLFTRLDSWHIFPIPNLSDERERYGIRLLETYDRFKTAAASLFSRIRPDKVEELLEKL